MDGHLVDFFINTILVVETYYPEEQLKMCLFQVTLCASGQLRSKQVEQEDMCVINDPLDQTHSPASTDHFWPTRPIGGHYFYDGVCVYLRTSGVQTQKKLMTNYATGPGGSLYIR